MIAFNRIQVISDLMNDPVDPRKRSFEPDSLAKAEPSSSKRNTAEHGDKDEELYRTSHTAFSYTLSSASWR
jgi:hypothetical protein